jgi:tetratricopeptide (TPR) repeat protein
MTHYDDEILSRFALEPSLADDREGITAHLGDCEVCRGRLEAFATVDEAMRSDETWTQVESLHARPRRLDEAIALKAHLDDEDRAAERLVSPLLSSPLRFRDANLAENPKARHAGVVRYLCATAHGLHEQRPEFSLLLARTAYAIALTLENRLCMALSLREAANAFRYLGRFAEALKALGHAEKLFDETAGSDPHDIAIVWFIRATVWMELGQLEDARALSARAANVFRDYGDLLRELGALLVEACCLYFAGNNASAAPAYEALAARARAEGNQNILARAMNDAANVYLNLEQFEKAERSYVEALVLFDELGLATEKVRVGWSLALVLVRRGDLARGAVRLDEARAELQRLGLLNDHGLATLDWAAVRLALGERAGVAEACRNILMRFESEGMMKNARLALAYVHEALARSTATPALLRQVRTYLERLPAHPTEAFVPVPENLSGPSHSDARSRY